MEDVVSRLTPYPGRLIVEVELLPEQTVSGFYRPDIARVQKGRNKRAKVLKVHRQFSEEHGIVPGTRVLLDNNIDEEYPGGRLQRRIQIVKERDVVGIILED